MGAGRLEEALRLANEALDWARRSDAPLLQAEALVAQAAAQRALGMAEADATHAEALALIDAKGDRVNAARLRGAGAR